MSSLLRPTTRVLFINKNLPLRKFSSTLATTKTNSLLFQRNSQNDSQHRWFSSNLISNKSILAKWFKNSNGLILRNYSHVPYTKDMIEQRVLLVLRLCDKINPEKLTLESNFTKDLGLDSLDQVDIVIAMEDEFGFEIPDDDGEHLITPKHVVQYVCDKFDVFD